MPVKIDASGYRSVEAEVEVPGTPEEVWQAIATGPGVSAWFVPCQVEERVDGAVLCNFGPGMDSVSTITEWEPPHRFVADSRDDLGPDDPTVATEWTVEAKAGGTCTVRVVHRWFMATDDWDAQYEQHTYGWIASFRILRLYLANFSGQPSAAIQVMGVAPEPKEAAWAALMTPLGMANVEVGERVSTPEGAPPLAGVVKWAGQPAWPEELLLRLEAPAPGIAHFATYPMGGQIYLRIRIFFYGDDAASAAAAAEPVWQAWVGERFPMAAPSEVA